MIPFDLRSPVTGQRLRADTPHSLRADGDERWPVVEGIPYLRVGRQALVSDVLELLDSDYEDEALVLLLGDRNGEADGPEPDGEAVRALVARRETASLREALDQLGFAAVRDYLVHRWTDPTFLAGLSLLEAHWNAPKCAFDLGCGIGSYLFALSDRGFLVSGADVVFAKLWIARNWVLPRPSQLICFDAAIGWPIEEAPVDLVMCHDALSLVEARGEVVECLRRTAGEDGWLVASHIRNQQHGGAVPGRPMSPAEVEELFPDGLVYDDAELTGALVEARAPAPHPIAELGQAEAVSVVFGPGMRPAPRAVRDGLALPKPGATLRRNPLYRATGQGDYEIAWPSPRYAEEYGTRATFPLRSRAPDEAAFSPETETMARRRELVELPERW